MMAPVCVASHIEGDFTPRRLKYLPLDMFSRMNHLHYLYTGTIPQLTTYPSLGGLDELETLTIVSGHSLVELPSFDDMVSLSSLNLVENYHVHRLPSLHALTDLRGFNVVYRNEVCCNGYLTGICDRLTPMCRKYSNASEIQCARESISTDDKAIIVKTQGVICTDSNLDLEDGAPSLQSTDVACGGVLYRQCHMGNTTGMCYNARMLVVTCETSGRYELMRRLQIERNIGDKCDPNEEAWLGCQ